MKQTICSVGDAILLEKFSESYDVNPIKEIVEQADVKLFNLENVLSNSPIFASSYCGGTWLLAKEDTLDDTLKFGFNGCSFANNHTMDFSYEGLFDTLNAAKKRELPICGAGKDLEEASDYAVIETENGKCAIISICATFNDAARAGYASDYLVGRPGLNPLRFSIEYHITPGHMKALKEMSAGTHIDGRRNRSRMGGYTPMPPEGCFGFGEYNFRSLMPFMTFEDGKLKELVLYPLRLDMHTGFPALADEAETKIIFDYLCERNKQFGTGIEIKNNAIEVKLND